VSLAITGSIHAAPFPVQRRGGAADTMPAHHADTSRPHLVVHTDGGEPRR
jgi:hypothetical protein